MASFESHIEQAMSNLNFLRNVNEHINSSWDWQVTTCFYAAVHLMNAHISRKDNKHYRTHEQVKSALNPFVSDSPCKLSQSHYESYVSLMNLSRRSRYLCKENGATSATPKFTSDRHLGKALYHLDILMSFINTEYGIHFAKIDIDCIELKGKNLAFFSYFKQKISV